MGKVLTWFISFFFLLQKKNPLPFWQGCLDFLYPLYASFTKVSLHLLFQHSSMLQARKCQWNWETLARRGNWQHTCCLKKEGSLSSLYLQLCALGQLCVWSCEQCILLSFALYIWLKSWLQECSDSKWKCLERVFTKMLRKDRYT